MLPWVSVVLVEPTYGINVGHITRLAANFGIGHLYFVNPAFNLEKAKQFAMGGAPYLDKAETADDLANLVRRFDLAIGTTAIRGRRPWNVTRASITLRELKQHLKSFDGKALLVLGRDTTGLTNEELNLCDLVVTLETGTGYTTLNVSHALAIFLYELTQVQRRSRASLASRSLREVAVFYARQLSQECGLAPHKAALLEKALPRLIAKATPEARELSVLVALLRRALNSLRKRRK